jgi:NifB/MoaA-like Fe-S oxidoreductase
VGEISDHKNAAYTETFILNGAAEANILPVTSHCNISCVFCSHHQNPPGVNVCRIKPCTLEEVKEVLYFIDPERPVVIGESASRIIEGEPLTHPAIREILSLLRNTFPRTPVQITTNGSLLDEKMVDFISGLGGVAVYLSLNSASERGRALLTGDVNARQSILSAGLLKRYGVPYHGSMVAMPHLVGWADLEETVMYLGEQGAETIRLFLPGYTRLANPALCFGQALREEIHRFLSHLRGKVEVPLTAEPPLIDNLEPVAAGVIAGSPAAAAGVLAGDVIQNVNGLPALTRVQAFRSVLKSGSPEITLKRGNNLYTLKLKKKPGERSGLVMDYDLDPILIEEIGRLVRRRGVQEAVALTSELAATVIGLGLKRFYKDRAEVKVVPVKNIYFGGSIGAAGLLTVSDFRFTLEEYLRKRPGNKPETVLLPGLAFDRRGRDLTGCSYLELERDFKINFEVL